MRHARNLTLHEVEAATAGEFKASSLSAYERGQRQLSVQRLERLATIYGVEVTSLVARESSIDLVAEELAGWRDLRVERDVIVAILTHYLAWIRLRRRHMNTEFLRIRSSDAALMGFLFGLSGLDVEHILGELDQSTRTHATSEGRSANG